MQMLMLWLQGVGGGQTQVDKEEGASMDGPNAIHVLPPPQDWWWCTPLAQRYLELKVDLDRIPTNLNF